MTTLFWIWLTGYLVLVVFLINVIALLYVMQKNHSELHIEFAKRFESRKSIIHNAFYCLDKRTRRGTDNWGCYYCEWLFLWPFVHASVWPFILSWWIIVYMSKKYLGFIEKIAGNILPGDKSE